MRIRRSSSRWHSTFLPPKQSDAELKHDLVSIITPAYNSAATIEETIKSVLAQTHPQWELLVVIDAGTKDRTAEIVREYAVSDSRIQLLQVPEGKGLALSRNFALRAAHGRFVAFLDSDDLWLPRKLQLQVEFMKSKSLNFSSHHFRRINADGTKTGQELRVPGQIDYSTLLVNNVIGCLTVMVDQSQTGPLQFAETKHEDYLLWLKLLKQGHLCGGLQQDLARYRILPTSRSANKLEMIAMRWKILREHEALSWLKASYYLCAYAITSLTKYRRF